MIFSFKVLCLQIIKLNYNPLIIELEYFDCYFKLIVLYFFRLTLKYEDAKNETVSKVNKFKFMSIEIDIAKLLSTYGVNSRYYKII